MIIAVIYCLVGAGLYFLQEKIFFHPEAVAAGIPYSFTEPHSETDLTFDDEGSIHLVQFNVPDSLNKGLVLYFPGNMRNVTHYARFAPAFTKKGYAVWMPDYPGFGKSTVPLSEAALYEMSLQIYKLARTRYRPDQIIIYGKSIGTGIASQLASVRDCRKLILETPYNSIASLAHPYLWMYPYSSSLLHFQFPTCDYLPKVTAPVTVFHGTADGLIPYSNALLLKQVFKPGDEFITIEGGDHVNLNSYPLMQHKLDSLLTQ